MNEPFYRTLISEGEFQGNIGLYRSDGELICIFPTGSMENDLTVKKIGWYSQWIEGMANAALLEPLNE